MNKISHTFGTLLSTGLLLSLMPVAAYAAIGYTRSVETLTADAATTTSPEVTVSVTLDSIGDIDQCTESACRYWQMYFVKHVGDYFRTYSSDVYPASQKQATYSFPLSAGQYDYFVLGGFEGAAVGMCGYEVDSYICPDGKHDVDPQWGLKVIDDPSFISYPLTII